MSRSSPSSGGSKGGTSSVTQETDASTAESGTTTVTTQIELPDDNEVDIRRMILDDYERCLCRHDVSFTDLLRIHKSHKNAAMKLTVNLEQAKKKEAAQLKKQEELDKALDDLRKGCRGITDEGGKSPTKRPGDDESAPRKAADLKRAIADIKAKIEELRRKKADVDSRYADMKQREREGGVADSISNKKREELSETLTKLAREIDETKKEIYELLHEMNQCLQPLNRRMNTEYSVHEEPNAVHDVQNVLDNILFDVSKMIDEKCCLEDELDQLRADIAELEKHIAHAEKMNTFLNREIEKLLAIGNRPGADRVDKKDYGQVIKFVEETFNILIEKLKNQNKEIENGNDALKEIEQNNERKQKEFDQDMAGKQGKLDHLRRQLDMIKFHNESLRNELLRAPKSPVCSESETKKQIEVLKETQVKVDKHQIDCLDKELVRVKGKNDELNKEIVKITEDMSRLGQDLKDKRNTLDDLRRKCKKDQDDENKACQKLETEIKQIVTEMDKLKILIDQVPQDEGGDDLDGRENTLKKKLADLDRKLKQAEADKAKLGDQLNKMKNDRNKLQNQLFEENQRRDDLEQKLEDVKDKLGDTEKRLQREREKCYEMDQEYRDYMLQNLQFEHTTTTRLVTSSGSTQSCYSRASSAECERRGEGPADSRETRAPPPSRRSPSRESERRSRSEEPETKQTRPQSRRPSSTEGERRGEGPDSRESRPQSRSCGPASREGERPDEGVDSREKRPQSRSSRAASKEAEGPDSKGSRAPSKSKSRSRDRRSRSGAAKQRRRSTSKSKKKGPQQIELQITPEITVTHQGSSTQPGGTKTYDVQGNFVLTMEEAPTDSSTVNPTSSSGGVSTPADDQKSVDTSSSTPTDQ